MKLALASVRCWWRNAHNPVRHPLGGFQCVDCRAAGYDLSEMVRGAAGYVNPDRHVGPRRAGPRRAA